MALDPRYTTTETLEPLLLDKDSGEPLANGTITFYEDNNRTVPKLVYELVNLSTNPSGPPNYTYQALPNPVILSANGTIQDNNGNNVALYYFPWDSFAEDANVQLYYVVVKNSLGTPQFTREGWPNFFGETIPASIAGNVTNQLSNPQFAQVLFVPGKTLTISAGGAGTNVTQIAPDWTLTTVFTGAGNITVTQTPVAGTSQYPNNPPYTLDFVASVNIGSATLSQRLLNSPDIWSPATGASNGFIAASILLGPATNVTITYAPSQATAGNPQTILTANNILGVYTQFNNTVQLLPAANTDTGSTGYVDIKINLPNFGASSISNVSVAGLPTLIPNIGYLQTPVNRQIDQLFNYYNALLQQKPIPSWLVGWDFPLNPQQFLGPNVGPIASGANTSWYGWDQTILFQSINSGITIQQAAYGALEVTAVQNNCQFALIQYLKAEVQDILNGRLSVNVAAFSNVVGGLGGTVSLWVTTDGSLPVVSSGTNHSIVATLSAAGKPATFNGSWTEITRSGLGDATFTVTASPNANTRYNDYGFSGWDFQANPGAITFFAVVVGFAAVPNTKAAFFGSVSLVHGDIPTRPAAFSYSKSFLDCAYYYQKSFADATVPAQAVGSETGETFIAQVTPTGSLGVGPEITLQIPMVNVPAITLFNAVNANAQVHDYTVPNDWTGTTTNNITAKSFRVVGQAQAPAQPGNTVAVHWVADARLGVV
jgi:hypothetical protein